ncbi:MAG: TlpA family protein disulfide reductase [Betaproteobacteria bacterium]|nr:MAG: TlpA family protein disulfide reductase [Betaproteobacteria bacterium]
MPAVNRRLQAGIFVLVAVVAGIAGYYFNRAGMNSPATDATVQKLMLAPLVDLNGKPQTLSYWRGKIIVVNFWATWCLPCREEIPALMKIHDKYVANGVEIVGIALDDVSKVRDFAAEMGIEYPLLIAGAEILDLSKPLGNRAGVLPFTVVLDRGGQMAYSHTGALTEAGFKLVLAPLL